MCDELGFEVLRLFEFRYFEVYGEFGVIWRVDISCGIRRIIGRRSIVKW